MSAVARCGRRADHGALDAVGVVDDLVARGRLVATPGQPMQRVLFGKLMPKPEDEKKGKGKKKEKKPEPKKKGEAASKPVKWADGPPPKYQST